jgi:hypothetical protein
MMIYSIYGKERKGKERKGKERKGRKGMNESMGTPEKKNMAQRKLRFCVKCLAWN